MLKRGAAKMAALLGCVALILRPSFAAAMNIVIVPNSTLSSNGPALGAFQRAGDAWSSKFTNNMTVTISAGLAGTFSNATVIGNTTDVKFQSPYDFFRSKLIASAAPDPNDGIVSLTPDLAHFSATLSPGFTFSGAFITTKANFKALGFPNLDATYGANDATITFNSHFAFDYDNRNGVTANTIDFQSVAEHEIGHALGFLSSVDTVDVAKSSGMTSNFAITPLDLFRFQDNVAGADPETTDEFTNDPRYLDSGGSAIFDDLKSERLLSTGRFTGDGLEASHWKDDGITGQLLGVMDPSINTGVVETIGSNDVRALDLIGYDTPEPTVLAMSVLAVPMMRFRTSRQPVKTVNANVCGGG